MDIVAAPSKGWEGAEFRTKGTQAKLKARAKSAPTFSGLCRHGPSCCLPALTLIGHNSQGTMTSVVSTCKQRAANGVSLSLGREEKRFWPAPPDQHGTLAE